jgi:hypothetical protein
LSRVSDQAEVDSFWKEREKEVGEPILEKGLIRVKYSQPLDLKDTWLLFFSTRSGLYYKRYPAGSAMARLLNTAAKRVEEYPLVFMPWDNLRCVLHRKDFFSRIFSGPDTLKLYWGEKQSFLLELDSRSRPLFEERIEKA